jgi:hypothetical protein
LQQAPSLRPLDAGIKGPKLLDSPEWGDAIAWQHEFSDFASSNRFGDALTNDGTPSSSATSTNAYQLLPAHAQLPILVYGANFRCMLDAEDLEILLLTVLRHGTTFLPGSRSPKSGVSGMHATACTKTNFHYKPRNHISLKRTLHGVTCDD